MSIASCWPPEQLQDDGHVRAGPPPLLDQAQGARTLDRLLEDRQRGLRIVAPALDHRERRHGVDRLGLGRRPQTSGDRERLGCRAFGVVERARDHPLLGKQGEDPGALDRRRMRNDVRRSPECRRGTRGIARRQPVASEPGLEDPVPDPIAPFAQRPDRRFRVGNRAGRAERGEGGLRRLVLEAHVHVVGDPAVLGLRELERDLERGQRILRRIDGHRLATRPDRGVARLRQPVRRAPVHGRDDGHVLERPGHRRAVPWELGRQQVADHGPRDHLVPDPHPTLGAGAHEPVLERLVEARGQVGVHQRPATPGQRCRARGESGLRPGLERRGGEGQLGAVHRALGGCHEPQHPPALGRSPLEPGRDEVRQRPGQGGVANLTPRGDQLLDHHGRATRALRDEDDDRGRRSLTLDALDHPRDLPPRHGLELDVDRRAEPALDDREVLAQRVLPGHAIRLVRDDERQPLVPRDPGDERGECPCCGVRDVEVLEHDHERLLEGQPSQPAQEGREGPGLSTLGVRQRADRRRRELRRELGHPRQGEQQRA